ncbi:hypothetical protein HHI36_014469 [Cryptolaemus montrouzieri]|uniref:PHD-type domain-containing protein n=1 Tax=Cryptolaemus montrouzieri TaxID=559131 RepID=A0ABD2N2T7_9CUCU
MSGDPPHHPHNRPWDFIGIPNWRQPQHAHMGHKHSIIHQSNWHPPTTESKKVLGQLPHNFALHQMFENIPLPNPIPGVDLSLTSQNGEAPTSPISLSVKDTKIMSGASSTTADVQPKCSVRKTKTLEGIQSDAMGLPSDMKVTKRASPLDSVLERLKPSYVNSTEKTVEFTKISEVSSDSLQKSDVAAFNPISHKSQSVIVPPNTSQDESSDSCTLNVPSLREDETISPYNTEDSLDSNKSRRKRKPTKTQRCSKNEERVSSEREISKPQESSNSEQIINPIEICLVSEEKKVEMEKEHTNPITIERRRSSSLDLNIPVKARRKTSSESETIDNIAAMVQEGLKEKEQQKSDQEQHMEVSNDITFVPVSVIKSKGEFEENICQESTVSESTTKPSSLITPAQKKETHFVEIENKLEEMFAGIEDTADPLRTEDTTLEDSKMEDPLLEDTVVASTSQDNVSSTSNDISSSKTNINQRKRKGKITRKIDTSFAENSSNKTLTKRMKSLKNAKNKKKVIQKSNVTKTESLKEISYDSGSNTSSVKSRGPFIHIKGPRSSPISVNIVNTASNEEDIEKRIKSKKFHDDSEYRHKVRSKGLHCSTLSNKYDAQTKDATWICVFCKKGPHTSEIPQVTNLVCSYPSGDLFGPYYIGINCEEFDRRLDDPYDKQFRSKRIIRALETPKAPVVKKSKRKHSEGDGESADPYLGIIETPNKTFEVWVHEECLVWSPGVYLVGPKIIGLQEAVWTSCNVVCCKCNLKGANICCLRRGCVNVAHVWCAKSMDWSFDEDCFKTYCKEHRKLGGLV